MIITSAKLLLNSKLYIAALSMFLSVSYCRAQTFEEKIAENSCDCIATKDEPTDDDYRNCVSASVVGFMSKKDSLLPKDAFTVEGIRRTFGTVKAILPKICDSIQTAKYEAKKAIFYASSTNEDANASYINSTELMNAEKYEEAIVGFKKAIKLDSKFVKAYDHLAICHRRLEKFDAAIEYYNQSLAIFPEGDLALLNIAVAYSLKNDLEKSLFYYKKLMRGCPQNPEGYFGVGKLYYFKNEYEKALNYIFTAHFIYVKEKSDYSADSGKMVNMIYAKMKAANQLDKFNEIAKARGVNINIK